MTELGTPRIRVSSVQIEGVHPLEPGVPGRLRQLGADGGSDLCPQVIGRRCAHGGGSPGLSTGVSTCVEKHGAVEFRLGLDPSGRMAGEVPSTGSPGAPGSRTISALWTTQQATPVTRCFPVRERRGRGARAFRRGVDCRWELPPRRLPPLFARRHRECARCAPGPHLVAARAFEEAMREEDVPAEQPEAEARSTASASRMRTKAGRAVLRRRRSKGRSRLSA